jgi:hypothetical protein
LRDSIDGRAGNRLNALLVVGKPRGSSDVPGTVYELGERVFRGVVSQLAPFSLANEVDFPNWNKILLSLRSNAQAVK